MTKPNPSDSLRVKTIVSRAEASSILSLPLYFSTSFDLSDISEYLTKNYFRLTCLLSTLIKKSSYMLSWTHYRVIAGVECEADPAKV